MGTESGDRGAIAPVVDVHTHFTAPADEDALSRRLDDMDAGGVDVQVLSPMPSTLGYDGDPDDARAQNEAVAKAVALHPGRFLGFATVPLQDVDEAIAVLGEARDLGLTGVEIGTRVGERALGHRSLRPFFEAAAGWGMPILVHGVSPSLGDDPVAEWVHGIPSDVGLAATTLMLGGTLADLPGLRVCLSHGGGTLPWVLPRLAALWDVRAADEGRPPAADLAGRLWVDGLVYDHRHVQHLARVMGPDRVVLGSCYPLPGAEDPPGAAIDEAAWFGEPDMHAARGANALAFLGVDV